MGPLNPGKLPHGLLEKLIGLKGAEDPRVFVGPKLGEDCAVIDLGDFFLILKADPVTFVTGRAGAYAVHVNANDVASMGARPCWFEAVLLCPLGTGEKEAQGLFAEIDETARALDIAVVGGHTEITPAVTRPVVIGSMQGLVAKNRLVTSSGVRPGDCIVMTKVAGLEGTAVLLQEKPQEAARVLGQEGLAEARRLVGELGISVVQEALMAAEHGVHAMHDVTEGGVATALFELAYASSVQILVNPEAIPVLDATRQLCAHFGIEPMGLLGSGGLLIALSKQDLPKVQEAFRVRGFLAKLIGEASEGEGVYALRDNKNVPLPVYEQDEITKVL